MRLFTHPFLFITFLFADGSLLLASKSGPGCEFREIRTRAPNFNELATLGQITRRPACLRRRLRAIGVQVYKETSAC